MFFVLSSCFPEAKKRKACSSYKKTLQKHLVTPHLFVPNKSLPPKQSCNQQKLGQIFAFRLDAVLVAGGLFDVILSMAGGGNDGVTLRFVSAMRLGLSRVVFRAQLFSTGKHGKIQRFGFCVFFGGVNMTKILFYRWCYVLM